MQTELMYRKPMITTRGMSSINTSVHRLKRESPKDSRETIHSGHFMVSDFEAEAQDDEDELAVPVPEEEAVRNTIVAPVVILKQNTLVCQFASPLDVDTHNKPEAVVLEGKYWKRKLAAVTAEYKKWRMFYRNKILGWTNKDGMVILFKI
ncbi:hypothetical protein G9C98_004650 [Cotesia typhae]|uniref:Uncharacterized protein n=1 Tax=Cotesia typhae TaxID=2053667 RepID=A0A8J5QQV7_9HYME|nr:hypothetical protein G9C98_004650 [Cotesia typhae]